jgi:hypothetical protein
VIVSASDLTRTRLCRAENCPNDAENYSRLCWQCERKERLQRAATIPHPDELECGACHQWKPDNEFAINVRNTRRRRRHHICTKCVRERAQASIEGQRRRARDRQRERRRLKADAWEAAGLTRNGKPRTYAPRSTA